MFKSSPHNHQSHIVQPGMSERYAQLKVKGQQGSEVRFTIKELTPSRKLMDRRCSRLGLHSSQARFMIDRVRIAPHAIAANLGWEDKDFIDAVPAPG